MGVAVKIMLLLDETPRLSNSLIVEKLGYIDRLEIIIIKN